MQKEDLKSLIINVWDTFMTHVQSDTLLLADVFENFRNKCMEI